MGVLILGLILIGQPLGYKPYAAKFREPVFGTEYEFLQYGVSVLGVSEDYLWGVGGNPEDGYGRVLMKSSDYGENFEKVYAFKERIEGIHITPNNIILVSVSKGRWLKDANCEIFRSDDLGKSFKKVLDLESGAAISWNFASDDEGYIFVSEYGYKLLPDNARRIYRSSNNGLNWKKVYEAKERFGHHNHVISIDPRNNNIIYQSIGDIHKMILRSTDRGNTWHRIISDYNPTSVLQLDNTILWGLDNHPKSGIMRYNTATKKVDFSLETPLPLRGSIYDLLYVNDVIYAGLMSYGEPNQTWDGSIFISKDKGLTWETFAIWPKYDENSAIGFYNFTSQGDYGFINSTLPIIKDGKVQHFNGTLRFKLLNIAAEK